jgi:dTDP-glucose 4,6-dehydratase
MTKLSQYVIGRLADWGVRHVFMVTGGGAMHLFAFVCPLLPLDANYAVGNFIRDAMAGGPVQIGGDSTPYRSYLYAADLSIWLWTLLMRGESGADYNVGSPHEISIANLARRVVEVAAPGAKFRIARQPVPGPLHCAMFRRRIARRDSGCALGFR